MIKKIIKTIQIHNSNSKIILLELLHPLLFDFSAPMWPFDTLQVISFPLSPSELFSCHWLALPISSRGWRLRLTFVELLRTFKGKERHQVPTKWATAKTTDC